VLKHADESAGAGYARRRAAPPRLRVSATTRVWKRGPSRRGWRTCGEALATVAARCRSVDAGAGDRRPRRSRSRRAGMSWRRALRRDRPRRRAPPRWRAAEGRESCLRSNAAPHPCSARHRRVSEMTRHGGGGPSRRATGRLDAGIPHPVSRSTRSAELRRAYDRLGPGRRFARRLEAGRRGDESADRAEDVLASTASTGRIGRCAQVAAWARTAGYGDSRRDPPGNGDRSHVDSGPAPGRDAPTDRWWGRHEDALGLTQAVPVLDSRSMQEGDLARTSPGCRSGGSRGRSYLVRKPWPRAGHRDDIQVARLRRLSTLTRAIEGQEPDASPVIDACRAQRRGAAGSPPSCSHPSSDRRVGLSQFAEPRMGSRCSTAAQTGVRTCSRSASSTAASSSRHPRGAIGGSVIDSRSSGPDAERQRVESSGWPSSAAGARDPRLVARGNSNQAGSPTSWCHQASRREAHQRDLPQARSVRAPTQPPCEGGAVLPHGTRPGQDGSTPPPGVMRPHRPETGAPVCRPPTPGESGPTIPRR